MPRTLSFPALIALLVLPSGAALLAGEAVPVPRELVGTWAFAEDRSATPPPAGSRRALGDRFVIAEDWGALVLSWKRGGADLTQRYALDGTEETVTAEGSVTRHRARWAEGRLLIDTTVVTERAKGAETTRVTQHEIRPTSEGLLVGFRILEPVAFASTSLYRRVPEGAAAPAKAGIGDLAWLVGAWTGTRGNASIEERWSPALGGAMLAVARTVAGGRMVAFEYLRIVERDGGLVYVAQPNGAVATEFVLTRAGPKQAVFENPVHDFPQRIAYELAEDATLTAEISDREGGRAQRFQFRAEAAPR